MHSLCFLIFSFSLLVNVYAVPARPRNVTGYPAEPCNQWICKLPDCFCSGTKIPGGFDVKDIPQIVMISFNDAVNVRNFKYYTELFNGKRKNPNGCDITGTFFVSHEWTNYPDVAHLYHMRQELADETISHRTPVTWWKNASYTQWWEEISGQREILHKFGTVKQVHVKGFRAPFLQVGGNNQFKALYDLGFLYDSSMPTREVKMWPYTLDYESTQECPIGPCPTDTFPRLWEIPLVDSKDLSDEICSMLDDCPNQPKDEDDAYKFFMKNFNAHYTSNKSPFQLPMRAGWFMRYPYMFTGLKRFIDKILSMGDVFVVSMSQALEWVKYPIRKQHIIGFKPWLCEASPPPFTCNIATCCYDYKDDHVPCSSGDENWVKHYFHTCDQCTKHFPWYGNPDGS